MKDFDCISKKSVCNCKKRTYTVQFLEEVNLASFKQIFSLFI